MAQPILNDSAGLFSLADTLAIAEVPEMLKAVSETDTATASFCLTDELEQNYFTWRNTHSEMPVAYHGSGVAGVLAPYTLRGDSVVSLMLILSFVASVFAVSHLQQFASRQLKSFLYPLHTNAPDAGTGGAMHFLVVMVLITSLMLSVSSCIFAANAPDGFALGSNVLAVVLLFALWVAYFASKTVLYSIVNLVFFGGKRNLQMIHVFLFLTAAEGVLLFPMVLLQTYFDLSAEKAVFYLGFVLVLNKLLSFYKQWLIFFRQNGGVLQTFLYFCALEIVPLLAFYGAWLMTIDLLKINF